ncbi:MAG: tetratricopeptide repeat protein [Parachlamydiaceae bacterium]|nr:tetratricopeptide repeat protein [Parachlamydiaceae bacterium]
MLFSHQPLGALKKRGLLFVLGAISLFGCQKYCDEFEPNLTYFPNPVIIQSRPSAFPELTNEECRRDWGKEVRIAYAFAEEQDYYRAITGFKRALVLMPNKEIARRNQINYAIVQSYYLANKCQETIEAYESCNLENIQKEFPAIQELLIILYDSYKKIGEDAKACNILSIVQQEFPELAVQLQLSTAFIDSDFSEIREIAAFSPHESDVHSLLDEYSMVVKSPERARLYQTVLPGAGYYYVGLKNAALSSFLLNTLFVWAAYNFFKDGNIAAGILTTSLETGWYFGGINGAGIAAREYNERVYEVNGREFMRNHCLFPILMLQTSF